MKKVSKLKHQVKSNMYYVFWGACTIAVMAGQIYVGTGYRSMSKSIEKLVKERRKKDPRGGDNAIPQDQR